MNPLPPTERRILTIAQVAALAGREKRGMARKLLAMHAHDRETGAPTDWLVRFGNRWQVNLSRLERAHPALFHVKYVKQDEFDALEERVTDLESKHSEMRLKVNGHGARLRELEKRSA